MRAARHWDNRDHPPLKHNIGAPAFGIFKPDQIGTRNQLVLDDPIKRTANNFRVALWPIARRHENPPTLRAPFNGCDQFSQRTHPVSNLSHVQRHG